LPGCLQPASHAGALGARLWFHHAECESVARLHASALLLGLGIFFSLKLSDARVFP
jgi:hypothetical protein